MGYAVFWLLELGSISKVFFGCFMQFWRAYRAVTACCVCLLALPLVARAIPIAGEQRALDVGDLPLPADNDPRPTDLPDEAQAQQQLLDVLNKPEVLFSLEETPPLWDHD